MESQGRSVLLQEGTYGCAFSPPIPCRRSKSRSRSETREVGKLIRTSDMAAELNVTTLIQGIPGYERYFIVQEKDDCDRTNFQRARSTYEKQCKLFSRTSDQQLSQLLSPYGGRPLLDVAVTDSFDYLRSLQHLLEGVAKLNNQGICHFDLHANNILVDHHGTLRIIDFGVSFAILQLNKNNIGAYQNHFSPGYGQESPELTIQRGIREKLKLTYLINETIEKKKVFRIAASLFGDGPLSLEKQRQSLERFWLEDKTAQDKTWLTFFKTYWITWDSWCVGVLFIRILQDKLSQVRFARYVWPVIQPLLQKLFEGLLITDPRKRLTAQQALDLLQNGLNKVIQKEV